VGRPLPQMRQRPLGIPPQVIHYYYYHMTRKTKDEAEGFEQPTFEIGWLTADSW
jgi:hypothetical protein